MNPRAQIPTNTLIGRFYFKLMDSKNLLGEFSNNQCGDRNYTESAILINREPGDEKFIGVYRSTWCEENGNISHLAELKITKKPQHPQFIFWLEWSFIDNGQVESAPHFLGEGMLGDGMLIGNYWENGAIL